MAFHEAVSFSGRATLPGTAFPSSQVSMWRIPSHSYEPCSRVTSSVRLPVGSRAVCASSVTFVCQVLFYHLLLWIVASTANCPIGANSSASLYLINLCFQKHAQHRAVRSRSFEAESSRFKFRLQHILGAGTLGKPPL